MRGRRIVDPSPEKLRRLVLVRHGESELNKLIKEMKRKRSRLGELSRKIFENPDYQFRLTEKGRGQARAAGLWLREKSGIEFPMGRHLTSPYVRARETAGLLGLPGAIWREDPDLRERDWPAFEFEEGADFEPALFKAWRERVQKTRDRSPFFGRLENGESMADVQLRVRQTLATLHRECAGQDVVEVIHGELIWGNDRLVTRMPWERFHELHASKHPFDHIHNCQIIEYSRVSPIDGSYAPHFKWRRSVCPWDLTLSRNEWEEIKRPMYTNAELLALVEQYPHFLE